MTADPADAPDDAIAAIRATETPDGLGNWDVVVFNPRVESVVSLRRDTATILVHTAGRVLLLTDELREVPDQLTDVEQAVLVARLRAWADVVERGGEG